MSYESLEPDELPKQAWVSSDQLFAVNEQLTHIAFSGGHLGMLVAGTAAWGTFILNRHASEGNSDPATAAVLSKTYDGMAAEQLTQRPPRIPESGEVWREGLSRRIATQRSRSE